MGLEVCGQAHDACNSQEPAAPAPIAAVAGGSRIGSKAGASEAGKAEETEGGARATERSAELLFVASAVFCVRVWHV
jgi:hypothetical protein